MLLIWDQYFLLYFISIKRKTRESGNCNEEKKQKISHFQNNLIFLFTNKEIETKILNTSFDISLQLSLCDLMYH